MFFANGEVLYITKRFDYDVHGNKIKQEDFSSLAQKDYPILTEKIINIAGVMKMLQPY